MDAGAARGTKVFGRGGRGRRGEGEGEEVREDKGEKTGWFNNNIKNEGRNERTAVASASGATSGAAATAAGLGAPSGPDGGKGQDRVYDVTILHVTDVHGWVGGHPHKPDLDVDLGDLATLMKLMEDDAEGTNQVVWSMDGGDFVDGTGYSDATSVHGELIMDLIPRMPYHFSILGNHDSEHESTVGAMVEREWFDAWNGRLVTTNVFWEDGTRPGVPYGSLEVGGVPWAVFGFMYNFDQAAGGLNVMPVEEALALDEVTAWMNHAYVSGGGIVVIAHADPQDCCEIQDIRTGVRAVVPDSVPLIILAGHRHRKVWQDEFEDSTWVIESGAYLEEIGVFKFQVDLDAPGLMMEEPEHFWVSAQVSEFAALAGREREEFWTELGDGIKQTIVDLEEEMGLTEVVGCSEQTWTSWGDPSAPDNVYQLWIHEVIAEHLFDPAREAEVDGSVYIVNGFTFRYSIFEGDVTRNDIFTALPFNSTMSYFPGLEGSKVETVYNTLNKAPWRRTPTELESGKMYDVVASDYDAFVFHKVWMGVFPDDAIPEPTPYTRPRAETQMMFEFVEEHWAGPCEEEEEE